MDTHERERRQQWRRHTERLAAASRHTAGPWRVDDSNTGPCRIMTETDTMIEVARVWGTDYPEGAANARLIAAAPELLEALARIVNDYEPGEDATLTAEGYNQACAAIERTQAQA